jgi:hypothetical protein
LAIGVFIVQELAATNAVLLELYQRHYNLWLVHLIFLVNTAWGIVIGFWAGRFVQRRFAGTRLVSYFQGKASDLENFVGKNGKRGTFMLLSMVSFNYVATFIGAWFATSFWEMFSFFFLGNLIWYALEWGLVLSVNSFVVNPFYALYVTIGLSILISIILNFINRKYISGSGPKAV